MREGDKDAEKLRASYKPKGIAQLCEHDLTPRLAGAGAIPMGNLL